MYNLSINTKEYDIRLIVNRFGKKTGRALTKTLKKTDVTKIGKKLKKLFSSPNKKKVHIPWA